MRNVLVTTALQLYIDTIPLESIPYDDPEFHNLYAKECQLFDLMRQMTWEEGEEYRWKVRCHDIDNNIPEPVERVWK